MRPWPGDDEVVQQAEAEDPLVRDLVIATRLLGVDPALVLHGGGNSSVKSTVHDVTGRDVPVVYMKSSGTSMAEATESAFTALDLDRLRELLPPTVLTDEQFEREVRAAQLDPDAAAPSLETLVHAVLPHRFVLHTHADVVAAITDTADGERRIQEALGPNVIVLDYAMPGADIGREAARAWEAHGSDEIIGMVIPRHGLFSFAETAREAYDLHAELVAAAHAWIAARGGVPLPTDDVAAELRTAQRTEEDLATIAHLRRVISDAAGQDMLLRVHSDEETLSFASDPGLSRAATRGPITPDHVTRTKGSPLLLGRDRVAGGGGAHGGAAAQTDADGEMADPVSDAVATFAVNYRAYVDRNRRRRERSLTELDPAPRVILDAERGLIVAGPAARELDVNADIARHTMRVVRTSESLGGYLPVSDGHVFDLEYWSLQQAKMTRGRTTRPLDGQVAIVTGAASGIGRACAEALLGAGCAVVGWDLNPDVADTFETPAWRGVQVDVTDEDAVRRGLQAAVETFGGLDILLVGAGIFPTSKPLGEMELEVFRRTMAVNVESVVTLYGLAWPLLEKSREGGRVVVVASKNVIAPGSGAAAYSSSKAALTQLSRVAALEWAPKGIRVNMMHPDAVFDTGLWTPELLAARAAHYGLTVDEYKRRNLLKTEVTSATCGAMALAMVTEPFRCTTAAQIAVDGGSDRTI